MKQAKIPILLLIGLTVALGASAWAQQIELLTFGSGLGQYNTQNRQMALSIGPPLVGSIHSSPAGTRGYFGFWEMYYQRQILVVVGDETPALQTELLQNYPNPFNPSTRIGFTLARDEQVRVELYDLKGRKVDTLVDEVMPAGPHSLTYQPRGLASGAYVILMRAGSYRATQRMMLVK